jgi:hypothetical protein
MKPVRSTKMCKNVTYTEVHMGKYLSDRFLIQKALIHGDGLSSLLFNFL